MKRHTMRNAQPHQSTGISDTSPIVRIEKHSLTLKTPASEGEWTVQPASQSPKPLSPCWSSPKESYCSTQAAALPSNPPVQPPLSAPPHCHCQCYGWWYAIQVVGWYLPYWVCPLYQPWGWVHAGYYLPVHCCPPWHCFPVACDCQMCVSETLQLISPTAPHEQELCTPCSEKTTPPQSQPKNQDDLPCTVQTYEAEAEVSSPHSSPSNEASSPVTQTAVTAVPLQSTTTEYSLTNAQPTNESSSPFSKETHTMLSNERSSPLGRSLLTFHSTNNSHTRSITSSRGCGRTHKSGSTVLDSGVTVRLLPVLSATSNLCPASHWEGTSHVSSRNSLDSQRGRVNNKISSRTPNHASYRDVLLFRRVPFLLRVCVVMIALLLLLAGDVERNPGPTVVTVDKVPELAALLNPMAANWYLFLGQLGVCSGTRDQIQLQSVGQPNMAQYCLDRGLHHWVVSDDNPTYERIIDVFNGSFLTNRPLARKVEELAQSVETGLPRRSHADTVLRADDRNTPAAVEDACRSTRSCTGELQSSACAMTPVSSENHSRGLKNVFKRMASKLRDKQPKPLSGHTPLTMKDLASLQAKLGSIAINWRKLGRQLHFGKKKLQEIHLAVFGVPIEALTELLTVWLQRDKPPPTLEALVDIVGGPVMRNEALARSLQQLQPSTSQQQQSLSYATTTDDVIAGYADQMRGYYRSSIPQCFSLTWPPPPTRKVFNLSMISHKQYNYGSGNVELVRLLYLGNVDEVMTKKSNVNLEDLFHLDQAERKVILIEGAPGAGKSTLAWHICQKWKSSELFQEFKLVVFVQLRDPAIQSAKSLADLLPAQLKSVAREVVSRMETKGGEGVLFVLDGWDEFPLGLRGNEIIQCLICDPSAIAMPSSTLLITSRPIASGDLHQYASSRVETIGFKQAEVTQYFEEALKKDTKTVQELDECLKERPVIKASCYLPLNTVIVVHLFLSLDCSLPKTLHGVFLQLVIHCIIRHIIREQYDDCEPPHILSLDDLPPDMQTQLSHICAMAYHGVMKNKVTFSENDLKLFNLPPNISTLSLIQGVVSFMPYRLRSYNFLHLSVQELLTSYHISKLSPKEQVVIFKELFGQPRFAAVFQHYAAFTKLQTAGIQDTILTVIQHGNKHLLLTLLHCLYEAQDSSLCQFVVSKLNGELDLSEISLSPVDCISIGYFLHEGATICPMTANLSKGSLNACEVELLGKELNRPFQAVHFEININLSSINANGNLVRAITKELIASGSENVSTSSAISRLDLSGNPIQDDEDGLSHLCQALSTNTSLVEIKLSNCKIAITEENGQALSHMLKTNKTLMSLSIFPIAHIDGRGLRYLSECIKSSLPAIRKLDLSGNPIQDGEDGLLHLCQALTTNTSVVELNLSKCSLHKDCGPALCKMLETNKTVTSIDLSYNPNIADRALDCIAGGMRKNRSLKCLYLHYCNIYNAVMTNLVKLLMVNDSLEELGLSGNVVSSKAAHGLIEMLKHHSKLKKLTLSDCELTHETLKSLPSAIEVNTTLEELDLSHNDDLADTALVALGESLKKNARLKTLKIGSHMKSLGTIMCNSDGTTDSSWRQFVRCLKDNHSLIMLITHHDNLDVAVANTVRRERNIPELQHVKGIS